MAYNAVDVTPGAGDPAATAFGKLNTMLQELYGAGTTIALPTLSFATPGNLSVAFSTRTCRYWHLGGSITVVFDLLTSTFTHTTASGLLEIGIPGLPAGAYAGNWQASNLVFQGITKANYTQFSAQFSPAAPTTLNIIASGSGQAAAGVSASDMPTGTTKLLRGMFSYPLL